MEPCKPRVSFDAFPPAQLVWTSCTEKHPCDVYGLLKHSARVEGDRDNSPCTNARKAQLRAARLRRAVVLDDMVQEVERPVAEERIEDENGDGALPVQHPPLAPPANAPEIIVKAVRFADEEDTEFFDSTVVDQCMLGSAHELCLKTYLSRVSHAQAFGYQYSEFQAISDACDLRAELEGDEQDEIHESGTCNLNTMQLEQEPWLIVEEETEEAADDSCNPCQSKKSQQSRCKTCFWTLDSRRMPENVSAHSVGRRWQDHVR
eukprot:TRINITY_DN11817_c0_g1_i1.p1 TRINITY_DN11817_c0_g1~~TRINITY_DN11817_c0_g1_i1.p1  ORF type:complete len:262 (+),score=47.17 TRINITY_DN11817_c0_g1_i1:258-1043(+)